MGNTFIRVVVGANLLLLVALPIAGLWATHARLPPLSLHGTYFSLADCAEAVLQSVPRMAVMTLLAWIAWRRGGKAAFAFALGGLFVLNGFTFHGDEKKGLSILEGVICELASISLWVGMVVCLPGMAGSLNARVEEPARLGCHRVGLTPRAADETDSGRRCGEAVGPWPQAASDRLLAHVGRHWRGECGLLAGVLVNGVAVTLFFYHAVFPLLNGVISAFLGWHWTSGVWTAFALHTCILVVAALVTAWQSVGLWRSARGRHGQVRGAWGLGARIVAGALVALYAHGVAESVPALQYEFHLAHHTGMGRSRQVIATSSDGETLLFRGTIGRGAARALGRVLDRRGRSVRVLQLNSGGGSVREALKMAEVVRARGLETRVGSLCASACTDVFRAGHVRMLEEGARVGFHQPALITDTAYGRARFSDALAFLRSSHESAGYPDWFIERIEATSFESMWWPTKEELLEAKVVTAVVPDVERTFR